MKKGRNRVLRVILAFLLVFTSFAPSLAFALEERLSWDIETPAGYDFVKGGNVRLYNLSSGLSYSTSISNSKVTFYNQFTIEDSATYALEAALNFRNANWSDEITYYDYQTISGAVLKQMTTLALPENAKVINLKLNTIPLTQKNVSIVSNYKYSDGFATNIQTVASKLATGEESITLSVTGQNEQKHGYFANTTIQTTSTKEVDFAELFTQLVPFEFQGDATVNYLELGSKAYTSRWGSNQLTKWFVTPGSYELFLDTSLAVPGGNFSASWKLENINITKETTLVKPSLPDKVNVKSINWYNGNRADLQLEYRSEGYVLNWQNGNTLTTHLEVKGHDGTSLVNKRAPLNNYMEITLPERYSGSGEVVVTVLNGEEELARASMPFELQDQDDTSIHGLVVTAEDEKGIPLQSGQVAVSERLNPDMYSTYNIGNAYQITQIYRTSIKENDGNFEAFIPNAYLLAGREYEIVVEGVTAQNEKIIYHKSITAKDLSTIHFKGNQLTELEIQTDKQFEEGYFGLTAVDMTIKRIVSWPYMVHPNQKIYVQSDYGMLVNAQLVNTTDDVGYYYSKVIETGDNLKQTIDLDALDANMTKLEAPAGYEQAKIGVHNIWYSEARASTFYISNRLDDFQFGNSLALTLDVKENGYFYEFYKYHYDADTPINLEIAGDYDGWISQDPTNQESKEVTYYTYFANQHDMRIEYVGLENPVVTDHNVYFEVMDQNGQKQRMVTNTNGGFAEATDATLKNASTNLVSYQIYQEEVPVGEPFSTNTIESVKFTLPENPGAYQLKLVAQSFPTDVTALRLNRGFHVNSNEQDNDLKKITFRYSDPEYVLADWANVRLMEIGKRNDNTSYVANNIYFYRNNNTKLYEANTRIKPEAEYYLIYEGQVRKTGNYMSMIMHKKITGANLLALSEFVIEHEQMVPISITNETAVRQNLSIRMIATLEGEIKNYSQLSGGYTGKVNVLISTGLYEPILEGINGTDGYSIIYPKTEIKTAENIRLTMIPTIAVNMVKNNKEVPFKRFGVLHGNSMFTTGVDYSNAKNTMRKLHITPGKTMVSFNIIQIEENETPWRYDLLTDMKEFNADTSLTLTDEFVPVQRYFYADNYYGRTYIDSRYSFYAGDLYLENVAVGKESYRGYSTEVDAEQPIRDYDGKFEYFENPRATIKIVNDQGKIVHKADYQWSFGYAYVNKLLAPGKYTLHYQLPVGPNKLASYSRVFDVVNANTPQEPTPPTPPVDNGGGIYIPIPTTDLEDVNGVLVVDEKWFTMSGTKGTVKEEDVLAAISKSASFEKLVLKGALVTDFALSSTLLKAIKDKNSKATVVVENELGSFTLPVAALNVTELAGKMGSDDLAIVVSVAKSERSFLEKGVTVLSAPVQFTVSVSGNGKTETVDRFGTFVERTINVTGNIDAAKVTAVKLMENGFVAAPTLFKGQVATIKSNTLGTFVIVQGNRSFDDVDNGKNWAESYIETLASKFIIKGKTETSYGPTDQMTRAQFAILIARSLGLTASGEYKGQFKDITTEQGAKEYAEVIAAYEAGIIQGRPDGTFAPNATITRTQAAAMLARAMKYVGYDASRLDKTKNVSSFKDARLVQDWAIADIELIVQAGIMNGSPDGSFNPNSATKRDQMAKMLGEFLVFVGLMGK